jgi:hypothetical protein
MTSLEREFWATARKAASQGLITMKEAHAFTKRTRKRWAWGTNLARLKNYIEYRRKEHEVQPANGRDV